MLSAAVSAAIVYFVVGPVVLNTQALLVLYVLFVLVFYVHDSAQRILKYWRAGDNVLQSEKNED
jgi:hypothetical protein